MIDGLYMVNKYSYLGMQRILPSRWRDILRQNTKQKNFAATKYKVLAFSALGLFATSLVVTDYGFNKSSLKAEVRNTAVTNVTPYANAPSSFADLVEKVSPSVVSVFVKGKPPLRNKNKFRDFNRKGERPRNQLPEGHPFNDFFKRFGQGQKQLPKNAQGSGFIISEDGYVVTNHHVIKDAGKISVALSNGDQLDARLIGSDERTDLALLKIKANRKFPFVPMSKKKARVGDWVLAVGNPFGLGGTVTAGIISAHGRAIGSSPYDYLQIDAAVNRGNSGGPAFNLDGEVVGVNTAIFSPSGGNVGIAFAIPTNVVQEIISDLRKGGAVSRGWLGIYIQDVSEDIAEGLSMNKPSGALITRLIEGGPAINSNLRVGDVILSVNGKSISDRRDLMRKIGEINPDEIADLEVLRQGKKKSVSIKLGKFPDSKRLANLEKNPKGLNFNEKELDDIGLSLAPAREQNKGDKGVVITNINPDSDAAIKGLEVGNVILEVNGKPVNFPSDVISEIRAAKSRNIKVILVRLKNGPYFGLKLQTAKK